MCGFRSLPNTVFVGPSFFLFYKLELISNSRSYVLSQSTLIELLVFVEWAVIMKIVHITEVGFTPPKMLKKNEASEK